MTPKYWWFVSGVCCAVLATSVGIWWVLTRPFRPISPSVQEHTEQERAPVGQTDLNQASENDATIVTGSAYKIASGATSGTFATGQNADLIFRT
ncbi:hypothetical protein HY523_00150 [Candidatus Berkelbacteria bacterium]|nr:hypothetical protein [Candidatus Berkelbacteria bacterium]